MNSLNPLLLLWASLLRVITVYFASEFMVAFDLVKIVSLGGLEGHQMDSG